MDVSKTECKRILRTLELKAYRSVVDALRAQGTLTTSKHEVLKNLAAALKVNDERYRSEIRRAVNDDLLTNIAQCITGKNTDTEWRVESMKRVPMTPMVASQTAFTVLADTISDLVSLENKRFSDSNIGLNNAVDSYRNKSEKNLTKYNSSRILESLLRKRKNHHQEAILSEMEKIKLNNCYPHSIQSEYQEISHLESDTHPLVENQISASNRLKNNVHSAEMNESNSNIKWNSEVEPTSSRTCSERLEIVSDSNAEEVKQKPKQRNDASKSINKSKLLSSLSKLQNSCKVKNFHLQSTTNFPSSNVEISSFEDNNSDDSSTIQNIFVNSTNCKEKLSASSNSCHIEISYNDQTRNSPKGRKPKRKGKNRNKRPTKITKVRKLNSVQRMKSDSIKETPTKISRISMRNARRRNYARMASGDYDIPEFTPEKKVKKYVPDDHENGKNKITDLEDHGDTSNTPIEISYSNPAVSKHNSYELETAVAHFDEDDMRPHTFNLIPASRRLKMLKKRTKSPSVEETPVKKISLSPINEQTVNVVKSQNDSDKLRQICDNIGIIKACDIEEPLEDLPRVPELLQAFVTSTSNSNDLVEIKEDKNNEKISSVVLEKKPIKPKSKITQTSTIENLHSILAKVKDSEKLKKGLSCMEGKISKNNSSSSNQIIKQLPEESNGTFIEVDNMERYSESSLFSEEENFEDISSGFSESEEEEGKEEESHGFIENSTSKSDEEKSPVNEDIVSITVDEVEEPIESDISEQLIDIESADVIIGDNLSENDPLTPDESKIFGKVSVLDQNSYLTKDEVSIEQTNDVIVINVEDTENSGKSDKSSGDDEKVEHTSEVKIEKTDFRYVADADDPCLSVKLEPAKLPLPKNTIVISKSLSPSGTIANPLTTKIISMKPNTLIKLEPATMMNSAQSTKAKEMLANYATNSKKSFVILEPMSNLKSKSLLKPINLPKMLNDSTANCNSSIQKPKKLAIYSSLKNINLATFSNFSKTLPKKTNVTCVLKKEDEPITEIRTPNSNPLISYKTIKSVDNNPKRLIFTQSLEKNLKLVEVTKNKDKSGISSETLIEISSCNSKSDL